MFSKKFLMPSILMCGASGSSSAANLSLGAAVLAHVYINKTRRKKGDKLAAVAETGLRARQAIQDMHDRAQLAEQIQDIAGQRSRNQSIEY